MNNLKISLVQTDLVWEDIDSNLKALEKKILAAEKTDVFVLPEMFNTGFSNNIKDCYETNDGKTVSWMKEMANLSGAAIAGSMIFKDADVYYNRFMFVEPDGKISFYNKRHLFALGGERHDIFTIGNSRTIVEYKSFKILLLICYDLRFPVWSRNVDDYDIIIYTASWPTTRRNVWDTLLKARAIENQAYVIGVNRIGVDGCNLIYNGGSCIINPKGDVVNSAKDDTDQIISSFIDKKLIETFREDFPVLKVRDDFKINI